MRHLLLCLLFFSTNLSGGPQMSFGIPMTWYDELMRTDPVRDFYYRCEDSVCVILSHRPNAGYGNRFEIIMQMDEANRLVDNAKALDIVAPDPFFFLKVPSADFDKLFAMAQPIPPVPSDLPETDKEIGWKLIYCAGGIAVSCIYSIRDVLSGIDGWMKLSGGCGLSLIMCREFKQAWDKERKYYEALEKFNRDNGMGPAKDSGGALGASSSGAGASSGVGIIGGSGGSVVGGTDGKEPAWEVFDPETGTWTPI